MIRIQFLSQQEMLAIKEKVWEVCQQVFEISESDYYHRLSIFKSFSLFYDQEKIIGFLSFHEDEVIIDNKKILLIGVGHGMVQTAYRNKALVQKASWLFLLKKLSANPFRKIIIWGIAISHLSYRMGMRASKYRYPNSMEQTPDFYKKILDFAGEKYYKDSYDAENYSAGVKYFIKDPAVIPSEEDLKDKDVAEFVRLVPSAMLPENKRGVLYVFPVYKNLAFWIKRMLLKTIKLN
jgi:hypothetical protein